MSERVAPAARPMPQSMLARLAAVEPTFTPVAPPDLRNATPLRPQGVEGHGRSLLAQMAGLEPAGVGANTVMGFAASPAAIRAFHASPHVFDRFDIRRAGTTTDAGELGRGLYFTTDGATSMEPPFSGPGTRFPNRYEVQLNATTPLELQMTRWSQQKPALVREALSLPPTATPEEVARAAVQRGHDSVRLDYSPLRYNAQEWAVFDDSLIDIVRRYGLVGLLAGGGAAATSGGAEAAQ